MKNSTKGRFILLTLLSIINLSVPLTIFGLWIQAVNMGSNHEERVDIFHSYFPEFLQGRYDTTYLSIVFGILSVVFCIWNLNYAKRFGKVLNMAILIIAGILLLLNMWSLM